MKIVISTAGAMTVPKSRPPGQNQDKRRDERVLLGVVGVHLEQRDDRQHDEHDDLDAEQPVLQPGRNLDAAITDVGHHRDPDDPGDGRPQRAVGQIRGGLPAEVADEGERIGARDLGQVRHHDHVGGDDAPAAEPADDGAERPRRPGERGAAVGLGLVEFLVGDRDQVHRDERDQHDGGCLDAGQQCPAAGDDEAEGGGQAVGRRRRRHADDDARHQAEGTALEALAFHGVPRERW